MSLFIEVVQGLGLTDGRQANVDDVLLNVLGAALAIVCADLRRGADRHRGRVGASLEAPAATPAPHRGSHR